MTFGPRRPGHGDFALRMESFLSAHRREHNWRGPLRAEEADGHVEVLDIDEPPRSNLDARVTFAICAHGPIVIHAGGKIAKMRWRQYFARCRLKIHHVEGLVWGGDHFLALLNRIQPAKKLLLREFARRHIDERSGKKPWTSQQWTRRKHL